MTWDTIRFVWKPGAAPFVDAFGDNLNVGEVERALSEACRRGHAEVTEFTVAPRYQAADHPCGGHDWFVEFTEPARAPAVFVRVLDETLQALNTDYRFRRAGDAGMRAPRVLEVPPGTFYRWMRERGVGDQHKVPRVSHDRTVADGLLAVMTARRQEPLLVVGS